MTKTSPATSGRLLSLDVFRGLTIILMILVNSPGNQTAYHALNHSMWNGCTLADLVFPFFIFIVGVSLVFSLNKFKEQDLPLHKVMPKVINRSIIIFLIGLFLNAFPRHFDFETIRVYGVLQRIAICYLLASWIYLTTSIRTQFLIFMSLLLGYWILMTSVPVPGFGKGNLTEAGNLAGYIDRLVFSANHLYEKIFDPEGILSALPALASTLLGCLTGTWLLSNYPKQSKLRAMTWVGILALVLGWTWGLFFPINKNLWTSSYVLWTGGIALLVLALCYWLIEMKHWKKWSRPLEIFGVNAIAAYFLHIFFLKIQAMIHMTASDGSQTNLRIYMTQHLFGWASSHAASLMYALSYIGLWLLVLGILYRKKIFIKV